VVEQGHSGAGAADLFFEAEGAAGGVGVHYEDEGEKGGFADEGLGRAWVRSHTPIITMFGSFLPSLGRQQPESTRV
jgi:hypothetical protein